MVDFSELFCDDAGMPRKTDADGKNNNGSNNKEWEIDIKKIVSTNFDIIINRQLQGDWHRLSPDVKQRLSDLTSLRRTLEGIKARGLGHSSWIVHKVGERLFEPAKERVYRIKTSNGKAAGKLERVLEESPNERLVQQVLTEIQNRWDAKNTTSHSLRSANVY